MPNFNVESSRQPIRVNFGLDLTGATGLTMSFRPALGPEPLPVTPTIGAVDVIVDNVEYKSGEYLEYLTTEGMFREYVGLWQKRAECTLPTGENISTNFDTFLVRE
jgi:hypothetical protein